MVVTKKNNQSWARSTTIATNFQSSRIWKIRNWGLKVFYNDVLYIQKRARIILSLLYSVVEIELFA